MNWVFGKQRKSRSCPGSSLGNSVNVRVFFVFLGQLSQIEDVRG